MRVGDGSQDADSLIAGPDGPTWCWIAVVDGDLRVVKVCVEPGPEVVAVSHVFIMGG
jgi:hypothetical protein